MCDWPKIREQTLGFDPIMQLTRAFSTRLGKYTPNVPNFNIKNVFRVKLEPVPVSAQAAPLQAAIDKSIFHLRSKQRLHHDSMYSGALRSPLRYCVLHRYLLPSAFMLRFVLAYGENNKVPHHPPPLSRTLRVLCEVQHLFCVAGYGGVRSSWESSRESNVAVCLLEVAGVHVRDDAGAHALRPVHAAIQIQSP